MKNIGILIIIGFILILWYISSILNKPTLNRMHNYYEDDVQGRTLANIIIAICLVLSFMLGRIFH